MTPRLPGTVLAVLTLLLAGCAAPRPSQPSAPADVEPRIQYTINTAWRYASGPLPGAEAEGFDDRGWQQVDVPHTWNAADAFTRELEYRRGEGWYRKVLTIDPALHGRRLFLRFEGANQVADVWVNGRTAGRHVGGYTAFAFDITDLVRFEGPNLIAVRVDNRHDQDIPPLNADFTFYGGIYRDVWLIAANDLHVTVLDHASPGVFIDTPEVSAEHATVRVRGTVVNATGRARRVDIVNRVQDSDGREVAVLRATVDIAPNASAPFTQQSDPIARPRLWSPRTPYLYRVRTEVLEDGRLRDRTENPFGFRWFSVDAQRGFFLNGESMPLHGTNRHQDRPGLGNALPDSAHANDVALVKATGFNFLRLAHYPQDPAVLAAMDRVGLLGWEEIPVVNIISLSPAFADHAERMLVEMIRQHYNHPSVVFWGYMNEVLLRKPSPMPENYRAQVLALAQRLEARVRAEDPSRATVIAVSMEEIDDGSGMQDVPDVFGMNLYFGWYYRTLEGFGPFLDSLHARHPARPLLISEYGAGSDERIHTLAPVAFDFSTEHQQRYHESSFRQLFARPWLVGTAVWNQFDFGSKGRHDSKPNLNQKGLLYFDRQPKDIWHYYRAMLLREPVLHIAARDWPRRAGSRAEDARQPVTVYSNLPQVELSVNGVSAGVQRPENATAHWSVRLRAGENRLEARGPGGEIDAFVVTFEDRASLLGGSGGPARTIAVNAGAHYTYTTEDGVVWEADRAWAEGGWGYDGGEPRLRHHRIYGTEDDALYQAERVGVRQYRFAVPDGTYEVELRFVEQEFQDAGRRLFDVHVNETTVASALDLAGRYGRYRAVDIEAVAEARGGSGVTVRLQPRIGLPTISAIRLRRR